MRPCAKLSVFFKERKRTKKKEIQGRGSLWKPPQPRKSIKDAFGDIFLMISSATWKTLLGFPQLPQARRRRFTLTINKRVGSFCSIGAGSFYVVKSTSPSAAARALSRFTKRVTSR
jgi:hypothetical protein